MSAGLTGIDLTARCSDGRYGTYLFQSGERSVRVLVDSEWIEVLHQFGSLPVITDAHRLVTVIAMRMGSWGDAAS